ncbi:hypothetical protein TNCV_2929531 [Trichonephila clavipes]|nr:hypothetical protein TNCV_2929531 [Trichonephila clavipes]
MTRLTSVQEESDPVDDETNEDEDNSNNESSKGSSNIGVFSALEIAIECIGKDKAVGKLRRIAGFLSNVVIAEDVYMSRYPLQNASFFGCDFFFYKSNYILCQFRVVPQDKLGSANLDSEIRRMLLELSAALKKRRCGETAEKRIGMRKKNSECSRRTA